MAVDLSEILQALSGLTQVRAQKKAEEQQRRNQRRATIGALAGAGAGFAIGGPAGMGAGASVGSGLATGNAPQVIQGTAQGVGAFEGAQQQAQQEEALSGFRQAMQPGISQQGALAGGLDPDQFVDRTQPDIPGAAAALSGLGLPGIMAGQQMLQGQQRSQQAEQAATESARRFDVTTGLQQQGLGATAAHRAAQAEVAASKEAAAGARADVRQTETARANRAREETNREFARIQSRAQAHKAANPVRPRTIERLTEQASRQGEEGVAPLTRQEQFILDVDRVNPNARDLRRMTKAFKSEGGGEAARPLPQGVTKESAISSARTAIAAGKDPDAVRKRLESMGITEHGL